jgi:hypothetical protein
MRYVVKSFIAYDFKTYYYIGEADIGEKIINKEFKEIDSVKDSKYKQDIDFEIREEAENHLKKYITLKTRLKKIKKL